MNQKRLATDMKTIFGVVAVLVLTASTADAYVRRTIGGGHVVRGAGVYSGRYAGSHFGRGYYGHPVARGAAVVAAGAAAGAATGWGWNQPYYGGGYYGDYGYGGVYANRSYVTGRPTLIPRYYGGYGGYAAGSYPGYYGGYAPGGYYGAYAGGGGYPGYYGGGVYANRSYVTGRPTLFPRRYW
jgi:hypothetical protein